MHVVIGTVGTRGDVQPCLALGRGLQAAGFRASVATHPDYQDFVTSHGLGFRPVGGSIRQVMESDLGRAWLESGDNLLRYRQLSRELFLPLQRRWLDDALKAADDADAVIYYPMAAGFLHAAERRGVPAVAAAFVPWVPTGRIDTPFLPPCRLVPVWLRRRLGHLAHLLMWQPFMPLHHEYRDRLGLPRVLQRNLSAYAFACGVPHVHLFSEAVQPRPADWPSWATVAGFCFLDAPRSWVPPADLVRFLDAGPPPIYVGFGSMTGLDPESLTRLAVAAVRKAGGRAVLVSGWSALGAGLLNDDVFVAADVPHDWLFPRMAAVVHHGGVGTLAAGLRAGRPTVVTPFFGDQPYWGRRVAALGVGPTAIPRRRLSVHRLAAAIAAAVGDDRIRQAAAFLGVRLRAENGVRRAVEQIAIHLDRRRRLAA
jgi:sterol 3beta-glucosyltransferase